MKPTSLPTSLPTSAHDMRPTVENLARELKATGLIAEICKDFVVCKFTKEKPTTGLTLCALSIRFNKKLVEVNRTDKGFYVAFQP